MRTFTQKESVAEYAKSVFCIKNQSKPYIAYSDAAKTNGLDTFADDIFITCYYSISNTRYQYLHLISYLIPKFFKIDTSFSDAL